ncbi:phage tail protein [Leuconostoc pseudomesenteroides]|uniref:HK97-gp10 family putative phage morphogenesis protein n=1 Tax=Leuconostoc pseudomesenteroides TaxID=33968 RepID=UPI0021A9B6E2|nr:HK97-gp10 family putative phage morphogenesis protein [Leuconostoc pseudomesenteroides]MCT4388303.1 phage tail protein [Leuconostoc pseudomesenteroides]
MSKQVNYHFNGLKELQKALVERADLTEVSKVVKKHTTQAQQSAMAKASSVYTKGYSTGDTKKSIGVQFEKGGLTGIVGMGMEYNPYTEKGTRFMPAEPLLDPVFRKEKTVFKSDLEKLLK